MSTTSHHPRGAELSDALEDGKAVGLLTTLSGRRSVSKMGIMALQLRCWDAAMSSTC